MTGWLTFLRLLAFGSYVAATVRHDMRFDGWVAYLAHTGDVLLFGFNWFGAGVIARWIDPPKPLATSGSQHEGASS